MEAIVLAGGFGARLKHLVSDVPKPMAPVCGRPFLRFLLDDLTSQGVDRIVLAVGYKQEAIRDYFGDGYRGAQLIYSPETTPLLTGGAIKQALTLCIEDFVYVVNGDTLFEVELKQMEQFRQANNLRFVLAAKQMERFDRYGTLEIADGEVKAFCEKKFCENGWISGGVYLMARGFLECVHETRFSFESEILEKWIGKARLGAFPSAGYFIDIGVEADYLRAQEELQNKCKPNRAAFFDRDGTINVEIHYLHRCEDLRLIDGMPQFIKKWNDWGFKVIVVTNQAGIARGYYTEEDMRKLHRYMNERLAEYGAHIDAFYFCPHHPDFTGPCHCRKPEPGMIDRAIREFDLAPEKCVLFGDKAWDVEAGERCGIRGICFA